MCVDDIGTSSSTTIVTDAGGTGNRPSPIRRIARSAISDQADCACAQCPLTMRGSNRSTATLRYPVPEAWLRSMRCLVRAALFSRVIGRRCVANRLRRPHERVPCGGRWARSRINCSSSVDCRNNAAKCERGALFRVDACVTHPRMRYRAIADPIAKSHCVNAHIRAFARRRHCGTAHARSDCDRDCVARPRARRFMPTVPFDFTDQGRTSS